MLKEMADLLDKDFRQVAIACNLLVEWMKFVDGHGDDLLIDALSCSISSAPMGRARTTAPVATGVGAITMQSIGSPSSERVWGMKP